MRDAIQFRFRLPLGDFMLDTSGTLPSQGVTALFGRSGCGKTSLLRCIAGLEPTADAFLSIAGECWHDSSTGFYLPPHKRAIGYVFQEGVLFPHLPVKDNLNFGYRRTPTDQRTEEFERVVKLLALQPLLERSPAQLSGGEKQRVAIGRALLNNPRLLLMDEPMAALDRGHKKEILPYLERLHGEASIPIIYVTHDLDELARIADHLLLIEKGALLAAGPLSDMLARIDLPIARDEGAGALFDTRIIQHDETYHLTRLAFAGGELTVGWIDRPVGDAVRIRIHAKDVSLALEPPGLTSILNVMPVTVLEMAAHGRGRMIVKLDLGGTPLLARITQKSQANLGLIPGMHIYAQIKSVALSL
ncbi:molybdenum ABC transporter ATP-binding protein [Sedimenticola sp.]|uniref:molybdenum ABC transporter ATP-binding protein n=1 Tax=Sedimenticola sp. TaxID=1940285 RepID=UPI003D112579